MDLGSGSWARYLGLAENDVHGAVRSGDAAVLHRFLGQWDGTRDELKEAIDAYDEHGKWKYPPQIGRMADFVA